MKKFYTTAMAFAVAFSLSATLQAQNTLTAQEKKDGWKLLFDGKTTAGWHGYDKGTAATAWKAADGALYLDKSTAKENRGDIITDGEFENYELKIDWKIDSCGNSGIMFNVVEDAAYKNTYFTGPEMQVLDSDCHPDGKILKHRAGDLYDLIKSSKESAKPVGEWNEVRIVSKNGKMEFYLNGTKTVEVTLHTAEWDALVAGSKFKAWEAFGKSKKGHIALQDHGDTVWFRNIKIKELK